MLELLAKWGCEFCFQSVRALVSEIASFWICTTKPRHFETSSYKMLPMTIVTGCTSPRNVTSSELSEQGYGVDSMSVDAL